MKFIKKAAYILRIYQQKNSIILKMENWQLPDQLYSVKMEVIKLALAQAELRQKDIETTMGNITSRVQTVLTVLVGLVTASIGFSISHINDGLVSLLPSVATILYSLCVSFYLLKTAYTGKYIPAGGSPSKVLPLSMLEEEYEDKERVVYLSLLKGAEDRIVFNRTENERRWNAVKNATVALVIMPMILMAIFICAQAVDRGYYLWFLVDR